MKRNCDEMDTTNSDMITDTSEKDFSSPKKSRVMELSQISGTPQGDLTDSSDLSEQMLLSVFRKFIGSGQHSFVEQDLNSNGYSLVNPDYVARKTYQEQMELDDNISSASHFILANMGNKVNQIGCQMKYLHNSLQKVLKETSRDSELHMAACNFVKKPGQTYHLYERPSGQKYFSMLSPQDWCGNMPHTFLGSWYLESDQSWTPAEERHSRFEGVTFIRNLIAQKSIQ